MAFHVARKQELDTTPAAPDYNVRKMPFMQPAGEHMPLSEAYTTIPPALVLRDKEGCVWTLGFDQGGWRTGEFEFDVVRNGKKTGEFACRIEFRNGLIRIYGSDRWRTWSYNWKQFI